MSCPRILSSGAQGGWDEGGLPGVDNIWINAEERQGRGSMGGGECGERTNWNGKKTLPNWGREP